MGRVVGSKAIAALALLATASLAVWHVDHALRAGPLWRDEAHVVNWASFPSLAEVWANRHLDAFPATWPLAIHAWIALAGGSDASLRALGALVGIAGLAALWWTARQLGGRAPLFALVLFGANPTVLVFGDSVRGYGLAVVALLLFLGAVGRAVASPGWPSLAVAQIAALLVAHTDFRNCIFVLAALAGAAAVAARRREWPRAALVLALGAIPALSLLPYLETYRFVVSQWIPLHREDSGYAGLFRLFTGTLATAGAWMPVLWALVLLLALAACAREIPAARESRDCTAQDRALFLLVTVAIAIPGTFIALEFTGLAQIWYFLSLLAVLAWFADGALALRGDGSRWEPGAVLALAVGAIALGMPATWQSRAFVLTNIDEIAAKLDAAPDDLIVVGHYLISPTFDRYYRGPTPWITLPEVDRRFQDPAAFKRKMQSPDPIRSELDRIAATLRAGHRVWWVGDLIVPRPGTTPPDPPPAPAPETGWRDRPYLVAWSAQAGALIAREAGAIRPVVERHVAMVNPFEHTQLFVAEPR